MAFGPRAAIRKAELRQLRTLRFSRDTLSTRSRAIFDKMFRPAVGITVKNPNSRKSIESRFASQGTSFTSESIPDTIQIFTRTEQIAALERAFSGLNKKIQQGKIITNQQQKLGRRQKPTEKSKLKISSPAPSKQASTLTGRFTKIGSRNALKIKGGLN